MSTISSAVQSVLQGRQDAVQILLNNALSGQPIESPQPTDDSIGKMINKIVDVQKQLDSGHIDVRV